MAVRLSMPQARHMTTMNCFLHLAITLIILCISCTPCSSFAPRPTIPHRATTDNTRCIATRLRSSTLDPVTYLRTEWVSAALCTNQTPRSADVVLQLGTSDGRIVNFVPRTVRKIITSSSEPKDNNSDNNGGLSISTRRQLKQQSERRAFNYAFSIQYSDQPADDLFDTPSSSVDVVISFQSALRMAENGIDWKRAVREAGRVLKPGGRYLFVESAVVGEEGFLEEVLKLSAGDDDDENEVNDEESENDESEDNDNENNNSKIIFSEVGYDNVDMVLQPHVAGVAIKALDADLTSQQRAEKKSQEEQDRLAELSLSAFERGRKKRRKKKSKGGDSGEGDDSRKEQPIGMKN